MASPYLWLIDESYRAEDIKRIIAERVSAETRVVVQPPHISVAEAAGAAYIVSVAGFPTGRHHGLVKAAEARLAVQTGAVEIWVSVDPAMNTLNEFLPDLITLREACPEPVQLGILAPPNRAALQAASEAAQLAGFNRVIFTAPTSDGAAELPTSLEPVFIDLPATS